ncbi:DNA ligase 1-like [Cylas formicarius]|uniref:DNA ligase 1-like n=1 Tax=Cylas formicarius TaxID=197179 RepID=UPI0029583B60|nr:DNA ligase 1-like [Cylas formicarius]
MESKWHLLPGQTLENTKIAERAHALHVTESAWNGITRHLDRRKILQENLEREKAIKKYLEEGSKQMTKGWENSLQNMRKRKEEERQKTIAHKKDDREQKFLAMMKEQDQIRKQYTEKVKKQIFMSTGDARELTSALITSEILFEREKQIELQNKIERHEREEGRKYDEKIHLEAEIEANAKKEQEIKQKEKNKAHGEMLKSMVDEKLNLAKNMRDERVKQEALENEAAFEETKMLEDLNTKEKMARKKKLHLERKLLLEKESEKKKQMAIEDKELDEVVKIYRDAKHRIECMKKEKEKQLQETILKRREKVVKLVYAAEKDRSEAEEKAIQSAIKQMEGKEMEIVKARAEFEKKLREDQIKNRLEVLEREKVRLAKERELKKWEMLNRYKCDEMMKKYDQAQQREKWEQVLNYRKELMEQMAAERASKAEELELEQAFDKMISSEDDRFFEYAREVIEIAKSKGRCTIPIEVVIAKYEKRNNISNMNLDTVLNNSSADPVLKNTLRSLKKKTCRCCRDCD